MFWRKKHKKIDFLKAHERFDDLIDSLHRHNRKKSGRAFFPFVKYLLIFIAVIFVSSAIMAGIIFFKARGFYDLAVSGKSSLEKSFQSAEGSDFGGMAENSAAAENYFTELSRELGALRENLILKNLKIGERELSDIDYLVKSAGIVSKAAAEAAAIAGQLDKIMSGKLGSNFSEFSPEEKQALLKFIYESGPELNGVKADMDLALLNMDKVEGGGMLAPFKGKIDEAKIKLRETSGFLSQAVLASELLPKFSGYPAASTFLVLFQNSDELRPTGGFLGTYGILQTKNGDIVRFDSHDIYHMDMPMETGGLLKIVPPEPIKKYLNRNWYLRDSNWSPDWPSSARQIDWFYHKENSLLPPKNQINNFNGEFDGLIAVTPELVASLLDLIGPVSVGGEEFNRDNFTSLLQYKVEQDLAGQNVSSWQRKEIIGKLLGEIKIKLFNLDYRQWPEAARKLNEAVARKNILIYMGNEYSEGLVEKLGAGGEIKETAGDYLMLVDSNMAALKTDAVMGKNIEYKIEPKADGLYASLKIKYTHPGGRDWRTGDYKSYTRIYVPRGSQLVKADGFVYEKAKTREELGKMTIEGFVFVPVGKSASLNIEYKLPKALEDAFKAGQYDFYVQKQPGSRIKSLKVDLTAANEIKSYSPADGAKISGNNIIWTSLLDTDKEFVLSF